MNNRYKEAIDRCEERRKRVAEATGIIITPNTIPTKETTALLATTGEAICGAEEDFIQEDAL